MNALRALTGLAARWRAVAPPEERCHLCGGAVAAEHRHVVDRERRMLACACASCVAACEGDGSSRHRFRVVPERVLRDPGATLDEERWARLGVPVRLAFVFFNSSLGRWVALYPSPAGPVEAALEDSVLDELAAATALVGATAPDVEALVIRGRPERIFDLYLAPIDACYRLVGRVRTRWQGLHGGDAAWREIDAFFAELGERASPVAAAWARAESASP